MANLDKADLPSATVSRRLPWWTSLWVWWGGTTLAYIVLTQLLQGDDYFTIGPPHFSPIYFLGLFVPVAIGTIVATAFSWGVGVIFVVAAVIAALWFAERSIRLLSGGSVFRKICLNLLVLLLLTAATDLLIFHDWNSWRLFMGIPEVPRTI